MTVRILQNITQNFLKSTADFECIMSIKWESPITILRLGWTMQIVDYIVQL